VAHHSGFTFQVFLDNGPQRAVRFRHFGLLLSERITALSSQTKNHLGLSAAFIRVERPTNFHLAPRRRATTADAIRDDKGLVPALVTSSAKFG
jgi:hypothetical protein